MPHLASLLLLLLSLLLLLLLLLLFLLLYLASVLFVDTPCVDEYYSPAHRVSTPRRQTPIVDGGQRGGGGDPPPQPHTTHLPGGWGASRRPVLFVDEYYSLSLLLFVVLSFDAVIIIRRPVDRPRGMPPTRRAEAEASAFGCRAPVCGGRRRRGGAGWTGDYYCNGYNNNNTNSL